MKKVLGFALFCMALGMFIMMLLPNLVGRDRAGGAAAGGVPAVLLLEDALIG